MSKPTIWLHPAKTQISLGMTQISLGISKDSDQPGHQQRLRSAWASAKTQISLGISKDSDQPGYLPSDQSLRCALNGNLRTQGFFTWTAKILMPRLIRVSAGPKIILLILLCTGSYYIKCTVTCAKPISASIWCNSCLASCPGVTLLHMDQICPINSFGRPLNIKMGYNLSVDIIPSLKYI